jgi:hypothetical protein
VVTVKQFVASAMDGNGDPIFPRQSNIRHIDAPSIGTQKQPSLMREDVERCIKNATNEQERLLYAVWARSGLRISECLEIHVADRSQTYFCSERFGGYYCGTNPIFPD